MLIIWFVKLLSVYRYGENTKPFLTLLTSLLSLKHHYFFTFTISPQGNVPQACVPSRGTESCCEVLDMPPPHAVGRGPDRLLTRTDVFAYQALVLLRLLLSLKQSLLLLESISEQMEFQRAIKRRGPC